MKKIALITALVIGTGSVALADEGFDPNLANRYPSYANPVAPTAQARAPHASLHSAPVQLRQGRDVGLTNGYTGQASEVDVDRADRASSPYAGGGF